MVSHSESTLNDGPLGGIDAYAVFEALTGRKIERPGISEDYDDLVEDMEQHTIGKEPSPDDKPKNLRVGVINPYALVEAMIGYEIDRESMTGLSLISDCLQTDYDELFDLKHKSVLFAGLKLDEKSRRAERLDEKDMKILNERDLVTPDLSEVQRIEDLKNIGLKNIGDARIKLARLQNGKLRLVLDADQVGHTVSNKDVTMTINELAVPFRRHKGQWTPPNGSWQNVQEVLFQHMQFAQPRMPRMITDEPRDMYLPIGAKFFMDDLRQREMRHESRFPGPVQGATSNCWFVAALFSVFWSDPSSINRNTRIMQQHHHDQNDEDKNDENMKGNKFSVKFFDKGGNNNSKTESIEVDFQLPLNNSSNDLIYCRSSNKFEMWPPLYEKAFAKWISGSKSERPDITQLASGDPVKCMAQIKNAEPFYYMTHKHSASDLIGLVRRHSVNFKTIDPMVCYTYASSGIYHGSNLVANHAYSVLGWVSRGQGLKQYIVLRNPWGVTEPLGVSSYPGLLDRVERDLWAPAALLDRCGVIAIEISTFKEYFECLGVVH